MNADLVLGHPRREESTLIEDWEAAGASLANAASRFFDLSVLLDSHITSVDRKSSNLVTRIDSSLSFLKTTLNRQVTGTHLALANARKKLTCSVLQLPDTVLSDIFLAFVYDPHVDSGTSVMNMNNHVELIYRRLHTLLGVCRTWRNIGISYGALWAVVPVIDPFDGYQRILSTELSLQRAAAKSLHFAASISCSCLTRYRALKGHMHRFNTINIWSRSDSMKGITELLRMSLTNRAPNLSKLSIRNGSHPDPDNDFFQRSLNDWLGTQLPVLLNPLSVIRLDNIGLDWARARFSRNLVELWISNITLADRSQVILFLDSLCSAPALRDLKLVDVEAILEDEDGSISGDESLNEVSFPKLQSLHLESLPFDFLKFLFETIAPGSYCLTLKPGDEIRYDYPSDEEIDDEDIFELLKSTTIHRLILSGSEEGFWDTADGLRSILESVVTVKSLTLNHYNIDHSILKALKAPKSRSGKFPNLDTLEIYGAVFTFELDDLKPEFKRVLQSHPLQRMVLGGYCRPPSADDYSLDEDQELVAWFENRVPNFHLCSDPDYLPERPNWQLWDV
ncbi:unnamed protein product [Rhizoctonia solani]|nr:unnamed protein product [Rhizoctonia solani]